jgi:hypothetical protein
MLMRATGHTPTSHAPPIWTNRNRTKPPARQRVTPPQRPDAADPHPRRCQFDTRPPPTDEAANRNQPNEDTTTDVNGYRHC